MIPHATFTITLNGVSGASRVVQTNDSGNYTATNLPAGTYTITVSDPSIGKYSDRNVVLNVAQKRTVNAELKVGGESQTVTVEDNPVTLDTESSAQAGTISGTQLRELELVNRNFQQLVTLQPGVANILGDQPGFGGINSTSSVSVNGARTTANNWSVDGADINDSGSNSTLLNIPSVDAIQEFTLERSLSPGTERIDLGLLKNFRFSERAYLQLRAEAFNLFNHTNFVGPGGAALGGIDTTLGSGTFGQALSAHIPRTMQFSGKMYF